MNQPSEQVSVGSRIEGNHAIDMDELRITILHEHYRDSFQYVRELWKLRNRLLVLILLVLTLMFLQITDAAELNKAIAGLGKKSLGVMISVNPLFLNTLMWVVLLAVTIPYFQYSVLIDRQYTYLDGLEGRLRELLQDDVIAREGRFYLTERSLFQRHVKHLYLSVFPALLVLAVAVQWWNEIGGRGNWDPHLILDSLLALILLGYTGLYLLWVHAHR